MKDTTKKGLAICFMAVAALSTVSAGVSAFAGKGNGMQKGSTSPEMQQAIEDGNYDSFVEALSEVNVDAAAKMTEAEFEQIVEMHDMRQEADAALESGDYDLFIEIMSEIDPDFGEKMTEDRFTQMVEQLETEKAINDAIESNDYDAWVEAVSSLPHADDITEIITEEEFSVLVEMHEARQNGDFDTADELAEELGLPQRGGIRAGGNDMQAEFRAEGRGMKDDEDVTAAIEAGDYEAFIEALSETEMGAKLSESMNEDHFEQIVERHNERAAIDAALESEDYDAWLEAVAALPNGDELIEAVSESDFSSLIEMHNARTSGDIETVREIAQELGLPKMGRGTGSGSGAGTGALNKGSQQRGLGLGGATE